MTCSSTQAVCEFTFVAELTQSGRELFSCCGPLIKQGFNALRLARIEGSFGSDVATDLLWSGFDPEPTDAMYFTLCALHWMEIACLVSLRGHQFDNHQWRGEGAALLADVCATQGWDAKEIANAFAWQRTRLT